MHREQTVELEYASVSVDPPTPKICSRVLKLEEKALNIIINAIKCAITQKEYVCVQS